MGFELWVALRYLWSKRRHPFIGIIGTVSIIGICVGVAALIIVLSVMNGFDEELKDRIIGTHSHLIIQKDGPFAKQDDFIKKIEQFSEVKAASIFIEGQALLQTATANSGVLVRGIDWDKEGEVSKFKIYVTEGRLNRESLGVIIGSELAKKMRLGVGEDVSFLTEKLKKPLTFKVEGLFNSGMYEYDANLAVVTSVSAQRLFSMDSLISGISVAIKHPQNAHFFKENLQRELGYPYYVMTWMDMNKTLFSALKLEKIVMFLILAMIILVACLNIGGSLTIMVMDKTKDIGILKALGAGRASLVKIFLIDGLFVGLTGSAAGLLIGVGVCTFLKKSPFITLPKEVYYMDRLPVQMNVSDNILVVFVALLLSLAASVYPAMVAGRLDPVKALRYE